MSAQRADQAVRTRAAVLAASRQLFVANGYDATSLQDIADAMGVAKANVYYYFRTKSELLEALLTPFADTLEQLLDAAGQLPSGQTRTTMVIEGFVDQVLVAHRGLGPLNLGDPALRRDLAITRRLDGLALRGLQLLYGDHPTPDQQAGYWLLQDLGPVLRRLGALPDDELRVVLLDLGRRVLVPFRGADLES